MSAVRLRILNSTVIIAIAMIEGFFLLLRTLMHVPPQYGYSEHYKIASQSYMYSVQQENLSSGVGCLWEDEGGFVTILGSLEVFQQCEQDTSMGSIC